ncbi:Integrase-like, catalytic core [Ceraceosorus bombacis]|uniref:Integrase-like, catalytic core n=1 Tax=Ceraceosorus bombacis TaxID=401625 RepID=A0A0P1BEM8_9BASI|nr:Integrase-like, catalytic core [Ceraceosorus bombacis]
MASTTFSCISPPASPQLQPPPANQHRKKGARSTRGVPRSSLGAHQGQDAYLAKQKQLEEAYGKSAKSLATYQRYINQVRGWLADADPPVSYADGLDILGENSEKVCLFFLTHSFERLRAATLRGIYAALQWHFCVEHKCSAHVLSGWQKVGGTWSGNPAFSESILKLLKNKKRAENRERPLVKQSRPMLYPSLAIILAGIHKRLQPFSQLPGTLTAERTKLEFMHCYCILAYRLWTRCDELCKLTWGEIDPVTHVSKEGQKYLSVTLTFRKTNQIDPHKGREYRLFFLPGRPMANALEAVPRWKEYWSWIAARNPTSQDLVFPALHLKTGAFRMKETMGSNEINALLDELADIEGLADLHAGRFTSHCFRRGGAQDAVIYATNYGEQRKSLKAAQWWGGWSPSEHNETIIKYLMDEVRQGEHYCGDMEDTANTDNRALYFAGGATTQYSQDVQAIHQQIAQLNETLAQQTQALQRLASTPQPLPYPLELTLHLPGSAAQPVHIAVPPFPVLPQPPLVTHASAPGSAMPTSWPQQPTAAPALACNGVPHLASTGKPLPMRIPQANSVEDVVQQWEIGDPSIGFLPLRSWTSAMRCKGTGGNAMVFSLRKKIYQAYTKRGKSLRAFYQAYGGSKGMLKDYIRAIQKEARSTADH